MATVIRRMTAKNAALTAELAAKDEQLASAKRDVAYVTRMAREYEFAFFWTQRGYSVESVRRGVLLASKTAGNTTVVIELNRKGEFGLLNAHLVAPEAKQRLENAELLVAPQAEIAAPVSYDYIPMPEVPPWAM